MQKKIYKVLTPIQKRDGGSWFMTIGSGYTNKDDSINLYLDAIPVAVAPGKGMTIQIRELDEADLRKREANRTSHGNPSASMSTGPASGSLAASDAVPF